MVSHFDSIFELNAGDDFGDQLRSTQRAPPRLRALHEFEYHRQNASRIGAATTSLLFTVGKFLIGVIGVYIGRRGIASGFGAAAALVVVLVWVYYWAQIFLLGAEFTRAYAHKFGSRRNRPSKDAPVAVSPAAPSPNVNNGVSQ